MALLRNKTSNPLRPIGNIFITGLKMLGTQIKAYIGLRHYKTNRLTPKRQCTEIYITVVVLF